MKLLLKNIKIISILILAISFLGCEDDDTLLPEVISSFSFTLNEDTGTVTFLNISEKARTYLWDFGDGTSSTEINPIKTYTSGTYTIVLTASNTAGASNTFEDEVTIDIPDPDPVFDSGLLTNGDFESGADSWIGNAANVVTEGGNSFNQADVETAGDAFNVNLSQVLELTQDTDYILTFDASSDGERTIIAGIGLNVDPFTNATETIDLTTETQTFVLEFTATGFGGADSRVLFDMGADTGIVVIDNVSLVEGGNGGGPEPFDDGLLTNGDFEGGADSWTIGVGTDPAPVATEDDNTFYSVNVEVAGNPFDVNLTQKLEITQDETYTLTFDAWSNVARSILAGIGLSGGDFSNTTEAVNITTDRQTYTVVLTATGFGALDARVLFDSGAEVGIVNIDNVSLVLGGTSTGDSTPPVISLNGDAVIDLTVNDSFVDPGATANDDTDGDISGNIIVAGDAVDTSIAGTYIITYNVSDAAANAAAEVTRTVNVTAFDSGLLTNGDFESGAAPWIQGVDDANPAPVATENGNTFYSINVTGSNPAAPFAVNVSQKLTITPDATYTLTFDAWSDRDRSIIAGIGLSGGDFSNTSEPVDINDTRQTYTRSLTATGFGDATSRVLFDLNGEDGLVNIDNVSLVLGDGGSGGGGGCTDTPTDALSLPATFEACETFLGTFTNDGSISVELAANPSATGLNTSANVLRINKAIGTSRFAGVQNAFPNVDVIGDLASTTLKVLVYSDRANVSYRFGVNNNPNAPGIGLPGEVTVVAAAADEWVELEVVFTGIPPNFEANQLVIKPDNPVSIGDGELTTEDGVFYIDNIRID